MHNKIKFLILSSTFVAHTLCVNGSFDEFKSSVDRTMQQIENQSRSMLADAERQLEKIRRHMAEEIGHTRQSIRDFSDRVSPKVGLDVFNETDGVHLAVTLPQNDPVANATNKVELEAKGRSLAGTLNCGDYVIKMAITDGQVAQISYEYNSQEEKSSKDGQVIKHVSSVSTQSVVLPSQVDNLEGTKATLRENKLVLILPKKQKAVAQNWHRIEVK